MEFDWNRRVRRATVSTARTGTAFPASRSSVAKPPAAGIGGPLLLQWCFRPPRGGARAVNEERASVAERELQWTPAASPSRPKTFRPPNSTRWLYPGWIFMCCVLAWGSFKFPPDSRGKDRSLDRGMLALEAVIVAIVLVFVSVKVWTTSVILDDIGIRWALSNESGELRWDQVSGLGYKRE